MTVGKNVMGCTETEHSKILSKKCDKSNTLDSTEHKIIYKYNERSIEFDFEGSCEDEQYFVSTIAVI